MSREHAQSVLRATLSDDLNPEPPLTKVSPVVLSSLTGTAEGDITHPSRFILVGTSAWSSPCLLVGKPDGSPRFCTDYRSVDLRI